MKQKQPPIDPLPWQGYTSEYAMERAQQAKEKYDAKNKEMEQLKQKTIKLLLERQIKARRWMNLLERKIEDVMGIERKAEQSNEQLKAMKQKQVKQKPRRRLPMPKG